MYEQIITDKLNKLNSELKEKLLINPESETNYDYQKKYIKYIGNSKELQEIEKKLKSCGIDPKYSLYNSTYPSKINGYNVRILPKGTNIYKTFMGFVTEKIIRENSNELPNMPSYFSNKYYCYYFANSSWGSIVSFELAEDLILIDKWNEQNYKKMIYELKNKLSSYWLNELKLLYGYKQELEDHLKYYMEHHPQWEEIYLYTKPQYNEYTYLFKDPRFDEIFNPIKSGGNYNVHQKVFNEYISQLDGIDGMIQESIFSAININGIIPEEVILSRKVINKKLKFDYNDPITWTNWKIKNFKIPPQGLYITWFFIKPHKLTPPSNQYFKIVKFYFKNQEKLKTLKNKYILSYNVHFFENINGEINIKTNMNNILNFIKYYKQNFKIIALYEVKYKDEQTKQYFENEIKQLGYKNIIYAQNGHANEKSKEYVYIMVAYKKNILKNKTIEPKIINTTIQDKIYKFEEQYKNKEIKTVNIKTKIRNQILINSIYGKICFVHLDIGSRKILEEYIIKYNSKIRELQLNIILLEDPDLIMGDFNFTFNDFEYKYLENKGYETNAKKIKTTPYNRVDFCFYKKLLKEKYPSITKNMIIRTNYSDHIPLIQKCIKK